MCKTSAERLKVYPRSIIMEPFLKGLVLVNFHRKEKKKIIAERKKGSLRRATNEVQNVVRIIKLICCQHR